MWHGLKDTDITQINIIDNKLLRYICKSHAKTPVEFLFLETGAIPISQIISNRRLNYLYEILKRDDSELVKRVYKAQHGNPSKVDCVKLTEEDFQFIGENFNVENICKMSKQQFKNHIRDNIKKKSTFENLQDIQKRHSKVKDIIYTDLQTQEYLGSLKFSNIDCELLIALRSHTLRGIKCNFPSIYKKDLSCPQIVKLLSRKIARSVY